ncbi:MAG TPA: hypothetical protein VF629_13605 [Hymenobacter sp.]|jgi:hypothetical protein|uniref:hypothetical protein n=1 Tax=Hymenobacter sp. TaxID=1898978 RepID=UPI002EDACB0E
MHLRARIIDDVNSIADLQLLHQLFDYVQVIKRTAAQVAPNREAVLSFAGTLDDAEAQAQRQTLTQEFGRIEGEW